MSTIFNTVQIPHAKLNDEVVTEYGQVYRLISRDKNEWLGQFVGMVNHLEVKTRLKAEY